MVVHWQHSLSAAVNHQMITFYNVDNCITFHFMNRFHEQKCPVKK